MNHSLRALVLRLGRWSCGLHGYSCGYSRGDTSRALRSQLEQTVLENPAMESREVIGAYQSESEPSKPRVAGSSPARRAIDNWVFYARTTPSACSVRASTGASQRQLARGFQLGQAANPLRSSLARRHAGPQEMREDQVLKGAACPSGLAGPARRCKWSRTNRRNRGHAPCSPANGETRT